MSTSPGRGILRLSAFSVPSCEEDQGGGSECSEFLTGVGGSDRGAVQTPHPPRCRRSVTRWGHSFVIRYSFDGTGCYSGSQEWPATLRRRRITPQGFRGPTCGALIPAPPRPVFCLRVPAEATIFLGTLVMMREKYSEDFSPHPKRA